MANFSLGVMAKPLSEQIPELDKGDAGKLQRHADAIFTLAFSGYLTPTQKNRLLDKVANNVRSALPVNKG
jgi:hypothetical protein